MVLKILRHPHGYSVKMGRSRPSKAFTGLHLKDYMKTSALPVLPPMPFGYGAKAALALQQMYLNNTYGCCVIAAGMHAEGVATGNAGDEILYSDQNVETAYGWCGFVPGNPSTDQGCVITQVLDKWVTSGWPGGGQPAAGYLAVDPTNIAEIQTALYLFENLMFGAELPDAWISPFPATSGFTWDVAGAADPHNGHCFAGYDATAQGVSIATWGMTGTLTYAAIADYCASGNNGELYVVITQDLLSAATTSAPNGLDWVQLVSDFDAMGGNIAPPQPAPPPQPVPPPPVPPPPVPPPAPVGGVVPWPAGTTSIVIGAHGRQPQTLVPIPPHSIGYFINEG